MTPRSPFTRCPLQSEQEMQRAPGAYRLITRTGRAAGRRQKPRSGIPRRWSRHADRRPRTPAGLGRVAVDIVNSRPPAARGRLPHRSRPCCLARRLHRDRQCRRLRCGAGPGRVAAPPGGAGTACATGRSTATGTSATGATAARASRQPSRRRPSHRQRSRRHPSRRQPRHRHQRRRQPSQPPAEPPPASASPPPAEPPPPEPPPPAPPPPAPPPAEPPPPAPPPPARRHQRRRHQRRLHQRPSRPAPPPAPPPPEPPPPEPPPTTPPPPEPPPPPPDPPPPCTRMSRADVDVMLGSLTNPHWCIARAKAGRKGRSRVGLRHECGQHGDLRGKYG